MLRDRFDTHYRDLVRAWIRHQELRRRRVPLSELAASRRTLDNVRDEANTVRRAFAPDDRELESVLVTTYCDRLDETVFLYSADAEWSGVVPRFTCPCGDPVDGDGERIPA